jgi:tRNA (guanine-N7-)-methyltransferase
MIQPFFLAEVIRVLEPEGLFVVQTDNDRYWHDIRIMAEEFFDFQHHPARWPDAPRGRSRREIYALQKGMPIYRGIGKPKSGITYEEALIRAGNLTRRGSKEKIGAVAPSAKQDSTRTPPRHCPDGP